MKKEKYIAIFSAYILPHLGGIENYTHNLAKELNKLNYNVIIITTNYNNSISKENKGKITIIRLPIFNIFKNRYPIPKKNKEYKKLLKELDNYNIKTIIVNTRFHLTSHVGANYGKKNNIPVYLIEHGSNYVTLDNKFIDFFANRYEDFLTMKIKRKIKGFYGVSEACNKWLRKINITADGIWYNSIDTNQNLPKKEESNQITFFYAGRLIKQKGVENILKAFTNLLKKYNNIQLFVAGSGSESEKYINEYKNDKIIFLGHLNKKEMFKYYAKTDVFLYPPLWPEGLPTSILEAGLMNCAVIATKQGGIKEIINDNNGIYTKENVKDLTDKMELLINDKQLRKKIATNLNEDIKQKFSWEKTTKKIVEEVIFK